MDLKSVLTEVQSWPSEVRLRLIEAIWGGLCAEGYELELDDDLKALLDQRLDDLDRNPDDVVSWEDVKAQALERFKK